MPDAHRVEARAQLPGELVGDAVLNQEAVRCHARLAGVAEPAQDGAVDGCVQVRVLEDDERRVATQFKQRTDHAF
ncbi:hypothetical protein D9M72_589910 [compost metagenome]